MSVSQHPSHRYSATAIARQAPPRQWTQWQLVTTPMTFRRSTQLGAHLAPEHVPIIINVEYRSSSLEDFRYDDSECHLHRSLERPSPIHPSTGGTANASARASSQQFVSPTPKARALNASRLRRRFAWALFSLRHVSDGHSSDHRLLALDIY